MRTKPRQIRRNAVPGETMETQKDGPSRVAGTTQPGPKTTPLGLEGGGALMGTIQTHRSDRDPEYEAQVQADIQTEREAYALREPVLDAAAEAIHGSLARIAIHGSGIPYEGILGDLQARLWRLAQYSPTTSATKPAPKPVGVRASLRVFARDGYRCRHCGTTEELTVDHITPKSKGGTNDESNLQTLCGPCNSRKGAR